MQTNRHIEETELFLGNKSHIQNIYTEAYITLVKKKFRVGESLNA
jgi:hypothetical protein